ncbi:MAG: hypothetical protein FWC85_01910, partial [Elusimicrobia bacterium]|nr:hypothetical protein [Elusimicrobiota bacterium]
MSNKINEFVKQKFPRLGTNKAREIMRLLFELSKVGILPDAALSGVEPSNYADIKNHLLKLRYPQNFNSSPHKNFYLPKFNIDPSLEVKPKQINFGKFLPENIYYDTSSGSSYLLSKAKKLYPQANFKEIENLKTFQKNNKFTTASYNDRRKNLFIVEEKFDFFKPCPCTKGVKCCGYSIINTGFGCLYDCSYCFLQG